VRDLRDTRGGTVGEKNRPEICTAYCNIPRQENSEGLQKQGSLIKKWDSLIGFPLSLVSPERGHDFVSIPIGLRTFEHYTCE